MLPKNNNTVYLCIICIRFVPVTVMKLPFSCAATSVLRPPAQNMWWHRQLIVTIFTVHKRSSGKVMFSVVSVGPRGVPMWPLLMMHWNLLYRASPYSLALPPDSGPHCTDPSVLSTEACTVGTSSWYASHWNAFLLPFPWSKLINWP